jgi:hypothetical protein
MVAAGYETTGASQSASLPSSPSNENFHTPRLLVYKYVFRLQLYSDTPCKILFKLLAHLTGITANQPFLIAIPPFSSEIDFAEQGVIIIGLPRRGLSRAQRTLAGRRLWNTEAVLHLQVAPQGRFVVHGLGEAASPVLPILISQNTIDLSYMYLLVVFLSPEP